jgi:hypothetical protein
LSRIRAAKWLASQFGMGFLAAVEGVILPPGV